MFRSWRIGSAFNIGVYIHPTFWILPLITVLQGKNLALDLRLFGLAPPVDAEWAAQVTTHTVSKIPAVIPPVPGLP